MRPAGAEANAAAQHAEAPAPEGTGADDQQQGAQQKQQGQQQGLPPAQKLGSRIQGGPLNAGTSLQAPPSSGQQPAKVRTC
jgi:hypothetical protein